MTFARCCRALWLTLTKVRHLRICWKAFFVPMPDTALRKSQPAMMHICRKRVLSRQVYLTILTAARNTARLESHLQKHLVSEADKAEAPVAPQIGEADLLAVPRLVHLEEHLSCNAAH